MEKEYGFGSMEGFLEICLPHSQLYLMIIDGKTSNKIPSKGTSNCFCSQSIPVISKQAFNSIKPSNTPFYNLTTLLHKPKTFLHDVTTFP